MTAPPADDILTTWLLQQIEAAEASTRALLYWAQQTILTLQDPKLLGKHIPGWHDWPNVEKMCQQRLAELAGMRDAVKACEDDKTVRLLGAAFDQHPDYREEWTP